MLGTDNGQVPEVHRGRLWGILGECPQILHGVAVACHPVSLCFVGSSSSWYLVLVCVVSDMALFLKSQACAKL